MQDLIELSDLKSYLKITASDDDDILTDLISSISNWVENYTARKFYLVNHTIEPLKINGNGSDEIIIPDFAKIDKIEIHAEGNDLASATLDSSNLGKSWWYEPQNYNHLPSPITIISSNYTFNEGKWTIWIYGMMGFSATVPTAIKQAIKEIAGQIYNRIGSESVSSETVGRVSISYNIDKAATQSPNALRLLDGFKRWGV